MVVVKQAHEAEVTVLVGEHKEALPWLAGGK